MSKQLEHVADDVAAELVESLDPLVDRWYARMSAIPQLVSWQRPDIRELVLPQAREDIGRELAGLAAGRRLPSERPPEVVASARMAAANGLPLWATLLAYSAGHAEQWGMWSAAIERRGLPAAERRALLDAGAAYFFAYADRCVRWLEIEYTRARELPLRQEEQRRVHLVRRLLDGGADDPETLGYDLSYWHLGVVCSGPGTGALLERSTAETGASLLAVAAEAATEWVWLGWPAGRTEAAGQLIASAASHDVTIGVGIVEEGVDGFRETHRQAQTATAIGGRLGHRAVAYADVALEDLAAQDDTRAQAFIGRELGPLRADTRAAEVLRSTLRAYFACSQRASSAASMLGVHERTVGNRLRRVEELLGQPPSERRAELEVALRVHALLAPRDGRT